jgi:hypothetical protein
VFSLQLYLHLVQGPWWNTNRRCPESTITFTYHFGAVVVGRNCVDDEPGRIRNCVDWSEFFRFESGTGVGFFWRSAGNFKSVKVSKLVIFYTVYKRELSEKL